MSGRRPRLIAAVLAASAAVALGLILTVISSASVTAGQGHSGGCPQAILYFSRGSGEPIDEGRGLASTGGLLYMDLLKTYGVGHVAAVANAYQAVPVTFRLLRRKLPRLAALGDYLPSVSDGIRTAVRNIEDLADLCPGSRLVLGGYSQGAQVTRQAVAGLPAQLAPHIAAVLLFGDPYFEDPEPGVTLTGGFTRHKGILRQLHVGTPAVFPAAYAGKVYSWCHRADGICQGVPRGKRSAGQHTYGGRDVLQAMNDVIKSLGGGALPVTSRQILGTCGANNCDCTRSVCAVGVWSGPGIAGFKEIGSVRERQTVSIICQATGEFVRGSNGVRSPIWDEISPDHFVSDLYVNTPSIGHYSSGFNLCPPL